MQFRLKTLLMFIAAVAMICAGAAYLIKAVEGTPEQRLLKATKRGDWETARHLLSQARSLDVEARDELGFAPLHYACIKGPADVLELLVTRGADVNVVAKHEIKPLHFAASFGNLEAASFLLERGAEASPVIDLGGSVEEGAYVWVEGDSPLHLSWVSGETPLHQTAHHGDVELEKCLLRYGANRNARNSYPVGHRDRTGSHERRGRVS